MTYSCLSRGCGSPGKEGRFCEDTLRSGKETQSAAPLVNSYEQDSLMGGF